MLARQKERSRRLYAASGKLTNDALGMTRLLWHFKRVSRTWSELRDPRVLLLRVASSQRPRALLLRWCGGALEGSSQGARRGQFPPRHRGVTQPPDASTDSEATVIRTVPIDSEQAAKIELLGLDLMRKGKEWHQDATMLLAIALAWKVSPVAQFKCNVDESAGLADVHDLHGHSVKA